MIVSFSPKYILAQEDIHLRLLVVFSHPPLHLGVIFSQFLLIHLVHFKRFSFSFFDQPCVDASIAAKSLLLLELRSHLYPPKGIRINNER